MEEYIAPLLLALILLGYPLFQLHYCRPQSMKTWTVGDTLREINCLVLGRLCSIRFMGRAIKHQDTHQP